MSTRLRLGDVDVDVVFKNIRNLHLSVHPPTGRVTIAAPMRMKLDTIRVFAVTKLGWIKRQQQKLRTQDRESPREYIDRESHFIWGRRYLLQVREKDAAPLVELKPRKLVLQVRPETDETRREALLEAWYRALLKQAIPPLIEKWQPLMGVRVSSFFVQKMRTRWGGCNPSRRTIRLNTELARKPPAYLEYVLVHEMAHLLAPTHGDRFRMLMDQYLPKWQTLRAELNRLPLPGDGPAG